MFFVLYVIFYNKDYNPNKISQLNMASCPSSIVKKKYFIHHTWIKVIWRIVTASEMSVRFITVRIALKITWMQDNLLYCSIMVHSPSEMSLKPPWIKKGACTQWGGWSPSYSWSMKFSSWATFMFLP